MLLEDLVTVSAGVGSTRSRLAKVALLADFLGRLAPSEVPIAVSYLSSSLPQGSIGVGWATLRDLPDPASKPTLLLTDVDRILSAILATTGSGSVAARRTLIHDLFARATADEQSFLRSLLIGELRQGALEGVMVDGIARASGRPQPDVRRAAMLAGDLPSVAAAALASGAEGLAGFSLTVFRPLGPMLAASAPDLDAALGRISPGIVEWKLDGARVQVHRLGADVRVYTRNLADVSDRLPEVVGAVGNLPVESVILDGEVIALNRDARPHPFQVTMSRFGSRTDVESLRAAVPLSSFYFDVLHLDGVDLIDRPLAERVARLDEKLPETIRVPRIRTADPSQGHTFLDDALTRGHEGVMVKDPTAPYEAGRRGSAWIKVKRAHTLDLVVLAAEWGHGRRKGWLSNMHLGARDDAGGFVMLGKTFKGMTDEMLRWQTERLLSLETRRDGIVVHVRPELVVEVAFDGLQASTRYPGGLALRFARIKGYRHDKTPAEADSLATVRAIHSGGIA